MAAATMPADLRTLRDLLDHLGGIAPDRVRFRPSPGTATEADLIEANAREGSAFELVVGTLVAKRLGYVESMLAGAFLAFLRGYVIPWDRASSPAATG